MWSVREADDRANEQSRWALQSYMGYAFESYSTVGEEEEGEGPDAWSGNVNTNVQVGWKAGRC